MFDDLQLTLRQICRRTNRLIEGAKATRLGVLEETITDINLIDIAQRHPSHVRTKKYTRIEEGQSSGADWLWFLGRPGEWFALLVQAKLISYKTRKCIGLRQRTPGGGLQSELFLSYMPGQNH